MRRGAVWYFERVLDGRRIRQSLETGNVEEAKARRDAIEQGLLTGRFSLNAPTFAAAAKNALA